MVRIGPNRVSPTFGVLGLLGLLWCSADPVAGQTIRGRVLEDGSELPIAAAAVSLIDSRASAAGQVLTDSLGNFVLSVAGPGKYWVRAQRLGYVSSVSATIDVSAAAPVPDVTIRLKVQGIRIDTLVVDIKSKTLQPGRNQFVRRCATEGSICLTAERIRARGAIKSSDVFESIPGLAVIHEERSVLVKSQVGWGCFTVFLNNNVEPIQSGLARPMSRQEQMIKVVTENKPATINEIPVDDIAGIEVYRSYREVPLELRNSLHASAIWPVDLTAKAKGPCGVAFIWTKSAW